MEKEQEEKLLFEFDKILMNEEYAEAFAFAIDNGIERQALRICIEYVQEDDERTEREMEEQRRVRSLWDAMKSRILTPDKWKRQFEQEYQQRPVPNDTQEIKEGEAKIVPTLKIKNLYSKNIGIIGTNSDNASWECKVVWY